MKHKQPLLLLLLIWSLLGVSILMGETLRIMPLGDSITSGVTDHIDSKTDVGYRAPLYAQLKGAGYTVNFVGTLKTGTSVEPVFDTDNEGHPNWTSFQLAEHIFDYLNNTQPDIILLHIGTNDRIKSVDGVEDLLNEIDHYEDSSGHQIHIIIAKIINRRDYDPIIAVFNRNLEDLIAKRRQAGDILSLIDMDSNAALLESDYSNNTHPNNTGYEKMASVWFNAIETPYEPFNTSLGTFPTTLVDNSYIIYTRINETKQTIEFETEIPDNGIKF